MSFAVQCKVRLVRGLEMETKIGERELVSLFIAVFIWVQELLISETVTFIEKQISASKLPVLAVKMIKKPTTAFMPNYTAKSFKILSAFMQHNIKRAL